MVIAVPPGPRTSIVLKAGSTPSVTAVLQDTSPEAIQIRLEEIAFAWHETLGVPPNADAAALRRAMARLALIYHPGRN